jgi:hypothetical protein
LFLRKNERGERLLGSSSADYAMEGSEDWDDFIRDHTTSTPIGPRAISFCVPESLIFPEFLKRMKTRVAQCLGASKPSKCTCTLNLKATRYQEQATLACSGRRLCLPKHQIYRKHEHSTHLPVKRSRLPVLKHSSNWGVSCSTSTNISGPLKSQPSTTSGNHFHQQPTLATCTKRALAAQGCWCGRESFELRHGDGCLA